MIVAGDRVEQIAVVMVPGNYYPALSATFGLSGLGRPSARITSRVIRRATPPADSAMRMALVAGRLFTGRDNQVGAPPTIILNQEIARRCFGAENPVGRRVKDLDRKKEWEVIGVVADAKYRDLRESALPMYYVPPRTQAPYGLQLHVRTALDPRTLTTPIAEALRTLDPGIPFTGVRTLEGQSEIGLVQDRLIATASATFGLSGLALALVGLYGVLAFIVARRTNEIGIRMALGARRADVLRLILGDTSRIVLIGAALGVAGAYAGRRLIQSLLFGVSPSDHWSVLGAALVLSSAAALAVLLPAARAVRVDPMTALRHE